MDIYAVKDGLGALKNLPALLVSAVYWPVHVIGAQLGGDPTNPAALNSDADGNLLVHTALAASGVTPITGAFGSSTQSAVFTPLAGRPFNVSLWGTFSATTVLERSFDGGTTWLPLTGGGYPISSWTAPVSEQVVEYETGVQYRLDCTYASGSVNYRISQ